MIHLIANSNIHIDPKNKGKFTHYCKSKGYKGVTCECICEALKSGNTERVREAVFAYNFGFKKNGKKCSCVEEIKKGKKNGIKVRESYSGISFR